MYKKIIILSILSFSLFSCGEEGDTAGGKIVQSVYDAGDFSMTIPANWEVLQNVSEILPKPSNGEIVFDVVSTVLNDNFYRNILVLKQEGNLNVSSLDFIIGNYIGAKKEYFYIKDISEKNVLINSIKTKMYEFDARYSEDTPIVKFLQTGIVCDSNGYIITIALEKNNVNIERYERLLGTFKCKNSNKNITLKE